MKYSMPSLTANESVDGTTLKPHESSLHAISFALVPGQAACTERTESKFVAFAQVVMTAVPLNAAVYRYQMSGLPPEIPHEAVPSLEAFVVVPTTDPGLSAAALWQLSFPGCARNEP